MPRLVQGPKYEKVANDTYDVSGEYNTMPTKTKTPTLPLFRVSDNLKEKLQRRYCIWLVSAFFFILFIIILASFHTTQDLSKSVQIKYPSEYYGGGYRVYKIRNGGSIETETPQTYGKHKGNGTTTVVLPTTENMILVPTTAYGDDGEAIIMEERDTITIPKKNKVPYARVLTSTPIETCLGDIQYKCVKQTHKTLTSSFFFGKTQLPLDICLSAPGFERSYKFIFFDTNSPTYTPTDFSHHPYKENSICRFNYKKSKVSSFNMCLNLCMMTPACTKFSFDNTNMECRYSICGENNVDAFNNVIVCEFDEQCQDGVSATSTVYKINRNVKEYSVLNPSKNTKGVRLMLYDDNYCKRVTYKKYKNASGLLLPYLGYEFEHEFQYKRDVSIWKIQATEGCGGRVRQTNNVLSSGGYPSYFQNLIHLGLDDSKEFHDMYRYFSSGNNAYCNNDGSVVYFYKKNKCPIGTKAPYSASNISQCV